jgi:hypothetical protein
MTPILVSQKTLQVASRKSPSFIILPVGLLSGDVNGPFGAFGTLSFLC